MFLEFMTISISAGTNLSRNSVLQGVDTIMLEELTYLLSPILHKSGLGHEIRARRSADRTQHQQVKVSHLIRSACVMVTIR